MIKEYFSELSIPETGVCVNGVSLEREILGYMTSEIKGRDDISASIEEMEVGKSDGTKMKNKKIESKDITLTFNLVGETKAEYLNLKTRLKTLLMTKCEKQKLLDMNGVNLLDGISGDEVVIGGYPESDSLSYGKSYTTNNVMYSDKYVLSFDIKSTVDKDVTAIYIIADNENNITAVETSQGWKNTGNELRVGYARIVADTTWTRVNVYYTKSTGSDTIPKRIEMCRRYKGAGTGIISIRNVKMEIGSKETFRFPSPNDLNIDENEDNEIKVIFKDEPHIYRKCTVSGITFGEINTAGDNCYASSGEITLRLSDPFKYGVVEKTVTPTVDENKTFVIDYDGNYKTYPTFEITNNSDNGYIGFINERGNILQIGNPEEVDGEDYKANETLATVNSISNNAGTSDSICYIPPHRTYITGGKQQYVSGNLQIKTKPSNSSSQNWNVALKTFKIPADSNGVKGCKNFYCYINHWFETGLNGQTGIQTISFIDSTNNVIAGYCIFKNDMVGNTAVFEMWANNKVIKTIPFIPSYSDQQNPFNYGRGHNDILKEGEKLRFFWWGSYYSFNFPELKDKEVVKIQVMFGQYGDRNLTNQYVTRNYIRKIDFSKMQVDKWRNVPNKFSNGEVITINTANGEIIDKGIPNPSLGSIANEWENFYLKPGINQINCLNSKWVTTEPNFKIKYREVYL